MTSVAALLARWPNLGALVEEAPDAVSVARLRSTESVGRPLGDAAFVYLFNQLSRQYLNERCSGCVQVYDRSTGKWMWVPAGAAANALTAVQTGGNVADFGQSGNFDVFAGERVRITLGYGFGFTLSCDDKWSCYAGAGIAGGASGTLRALPMAGISSSDGDAYGWVRQFNLSAGVGPGIQITDTRSLTGEGSANSAALNLGTYGLSASYTLGYRTRPLGGSD